MHFLPTTNAQLEYNLVCDLQIIAQCKHVEMARFQTMQIWADRYPDLKFSGNSLSHYFDELILRARNFQPEITFDSVMLVKTESANTILKSFSSPDPIPIESDQFGASFVCLNSSLLRIVCETGTNKKDESVIFSRLNFTFYLSGGQAPTVLNYTFSNNSTSMEIG